MATGLSNSQQINPYPQSEFLERQQKDRLGPGNNSF